MSSPNIETYDRSVTVRSKLKKTGLDKFLAEPGITDIRVNQPGQIIVASDQGWQKYDHPECGLQTLKELANAMSIYHGGNPLNTENPKKSVILPDGERGEIVIPPACQANTVAITIRRANPIRLSIDDYIHKGLLANFRDVSIHHEVPSHIHLDDDELEVLDAKQRRDMKRFFELCIKHKLTICIVGGTGSGKTTFMKALADLVPPETMIITIEDVHELSLPHHWNKVHLFYGDHISPKEVLKSCMRMKPDRIFLTELRGDEAWDYLCALNTDHPGSLTTVHANNLNTAYQRIATLVKQSEVGKTLEWEHIMREVMMSIDVMVQFKNKRMTKLYYDPVRKMKMMRGDRDA